MHYLNELEYVKEEVWSNVYAVQISLLLSSIWALDLLSPFIYTSHIFRSHGATLTIVVLVMVFSGISPENNLAQEASCIMSNKFVQLIRFLIKIYIVHDITVRTSILFVPLS